MLMNFHINNSKMVWVLPLVASFLVLVAVSPMLIYGSLPESLLGWQSRMMSAVCHQQLDRTFMLSGIPAAVCGRCLGIYSGFLIGFIFLFIPNRKVGLFSTRNFKIFFFVTGSAIVIDGLSQWLGLWQGGNVQRSLLGVLFGISISLLLCTSLTFKKE